MGKDEEGGGSKKGGSIKPVLGIMEASVWVAVGLLLAGSGTETGEEGSEGGEGGGGGGNWGGEGGKKKKKRREGKRRFGIVSTGEGWKVVLEEAVVELLLAGTTTGCDGGEEGKVGDRGGWFKGVECCGVDAGGLHGGDNGELDVEGRVRGAVRRLVEGRQDENGGGEGEVGVVVLGCAGMVGMEGWVREEVGEGVRVVDGVKAGVGMLQGLVRGGF